MSSFSTTHTEKEKGRQRQTGITTVNKFYKQQAVFCWNQHSKLAELYFQVLICNVSFNLNNMPSRIFIDDFEYVPKIDYKNLAIFFSGKKCL